MKILNWVFESWFHIIITVLIFSLFLSSFLIIRDYRIEHPLETHPTFLIPIKGATIPKNPGQLPNAPREARNGIHEGIDIATPEGTPVRAARDGIVIKVNDGELKGGKFCDEETIKYALKIAKKGRFEDVKDILLGRYVVIKHKGGWKTVYAHLKAVWVKEGEKVKEGYVIGSSGCTGFCYGPHLHFAIYRPSGEFLGKGYDELELQLLLSKYIKLR